MSTEAKHSRRVLFNVLVLGLPPLLCLGFCCSGVFNLGDGHTSLNGKVVGPDDKPIAEAEVRLSEVGALGQRPPSVTDADGQYGVALTHAGSLGLELVVTVNKNGYKPFRKEFKVSERERFPKKIVLEPGP